MSTTTYGASRTLGGTTYGASGFVSTEDALKSIYRRAYNAGDWEPRRLRNHWWQFWRPTEHDWIEKWILEECSDQRSSYFDA